MSCIVQDPVPLAPFASWCRRAVERYGTVRDAALACGVDETRFGKWVRGQASNSQGVICVGRVDEVLIFEGSTLLDELYPLDVEVAA